MIVTIDGPAGAGKSTIARGLAERLGFAFLDTGAMYRAVALAALRRELGDGDEAAIAALVQSLAIEFDGIRTLLDGEDVSAAIRTSEVSAAVYLAADNVAVRQRLVELQRRIAAGPLLRGCCRAYPATAKYLFSVVADDGLAGRDARPRLVELDL